jgi:hypothetical protein
MTDAGQREYVKRMQLAREALSEGCCPICGSRLLPGIPVSAGSADIEGYCGRCGRFRVTGDRWDHTTPFGLTQERMSA